MRLIGMGGDDVTRAIAGRLTIDDASAEKAKRPLGLAAESFSEADRPIVEIIYELTSELITSIRDTLTCVANTRACPSPSRNRSTTWACHRKSKNLTREHSTTWLLRSV